MLKELLNKLKTAGSLCAAIATGRMYTPFVRVAMKRYEAEWERMRAEEKIKREYAKGGVIEPLAQWFELDNDKKYFFPEEWKNNNPMLNTDFESLARSIKQCALSVQDLADAMQELARQETEKRIKRKNTNNWRKMHGLPMRRKVGRKKW